MISNVTIKNEMPTAMSCTGNKYKETCNLPMKDVVLFVDWDLGAFFKRIPVLNVEYSVSLVQYQGKSELRVAAEIECKNARIPITQRIENILWAYNHQDFQQKKGVVTALPPRFCFSIEVTGRDDGERYVDVETAGGHNG